MIGGALKSRGTALGVGFAVFLLVVYLFTSSANPAVYSPSLNLIPADVSSVIPNVTYAAIEVNQIVNLSSSLRTEGYISMSISAFNASSPNVNSTSMPFSVVSVLFNMTNSSSASYAMNSLIFSNNANQTVTGQLFHITSPGTYEVANSSVTVYSIRSVAVFNKTSLPPYVQLKLPVWQYTELSSYGNFLASVETSSYNSSLSGSISFALEGRLLSKLAEAGGGG